MTLDALIGALSTRSAAAFAGSFGPLGAGPRAEGCVAGIEGSSGTVAGEDPSGRSVLAADQGHRERIAAALRADPRMDVGALREIMGRPLAASAGVRLIVDLAEVGTSRVALSSGNSGEPSAADHGREAALWEVGQVRRLVFGRPPDDLVEGDLVLRAR